LFAGARALRGDLTRRSGPNAETTKRASGQDEVGEEAD
jgi:hypothetical protein